MTKSVGIGRQMAKGAAWMILLRLFVRSIAVIKMLILARLLTPEDFGLVALATLVWGLLEALSQFNFEIPLIREQKAERRHYDTVWSLNLVKGLLTAILLVAVAVPAADFFNDGRIVDIMYALSVAAFIHCFENVGIVEFRKELLFRKDFIFLLSRRGLTSLVTITVAVLWQDYRALVIGIVSEAPIRVALSYAMHRYRPRISFAVWREYFQFSKWLVAVGALGHFTTQVDRIILGRLAEPATVGTFMMAKEIATIASTELAMPIQRVLIPGYAKLVHDKEQFQESYVRSIQFLIAMALPIPIGIWLTADLIVHVLLGDRWVDAIPLIGVLSIFGILALVGAVNRPALIALGLPRIIFYLTVIYAAIMAPSIYVGAVEGGVQGLAIAMTCATAVYIAINMLIVLRTMRIGVLRLVRASWRSVLSGLVMAFVVEAARVPWPVEAGVGLQGAELAVLIVIGMTVYPACHFGLWLISGKPRGIETEIALLMNQAMDKRPALKARVRQLLGRRSPTQTGPQ